MNEATTQDPIDAFQLLIKILRVMFELMFSETHDGSVPPFLQRMLDQFYALSRGKPAVAPIATIVTASRLRCESASPLRATCRTTATTTTTTARIDPIRSNAQPAIVTRPDPPPNRSKTRQTAGFNHALFVTIS